MWHPGPETISKNHKNAKISICNTCANQAKFQILSTFHAEDFSKIPNISRKIYDDKILCQTILNEVGFAMLPGSDFGLDKGKLLSRIAFVDFNGEEALRLISEEVSSIDNLNRICPRIVKGTSLLKEWIINQ